MLRVSPEADIDIGPGLSEDDLVEDVMPARQQLGYTPRFADLAAGITDCLHTYRQFLQETGPADD